MTAHRRVATHRRTMYDSVTVADLPAHAAMVASYIDYNGHDLTVELRRRFPNAVRVSVSTHGAPADVYDVERGALTVTDGARCAQRDLAAGKSPAIYCNYSTMPAVKTALSKVGLRAGLKPGQVQLWIAKWDGKAPIPPEAVALQYADPPASGGHYDVSVVRRHWRGVDDAGPKPASRRLDVTARVLTRLLTRRLKRWPAGVAVDGRGYVLLDGLEAATARIVRVGATKRPAT